MANELLSEDAQRPSNGIFTDCVPSEQPDGTNRFALNNVKENNSNTVERGNTPCGQFPNGYVPIGNRYTNDGRNIIWLVSLNEVYSEIGIVDKNCEYTTVVNSTKLGFKLNHQISATYRLRRGCEDVAYFVDGYNSDRFFNFDKPEDFYSKEYEDFLASGNSGSFTGEKWSANKFKLFPAYTIPNIDTMEVIAGGSIPSGTYNFAPQYLDNNLNPTNFLYASQPVSIYRSSIDSPYDDIIGSSNILSDDLSGSLNANKSIRLNLSNLDKSYRYYKIAVIQATDSTGKPTKALLSPAISINRTEFVFDGNLEGYTEIPVAEIEISKIDIDSSEHIEQLENKLILSNTKGKQIEYCGFQHFASKINSNYIVKEVAATDAKIDGNSKSPNTYWEREGYMGDDVYAMAIVYVFNDGLETPAFHIPGRSPGKYKNVDTGVIVNTNDQDIIASWTDDIAPWYPTASIYNALPANKKLKKWQVYNSSVRYSSSPNESYGAMSYHENDNVFYEPKANCSGGNYWGVDAAGVNLENKPIRHHKFPSRSAEPHVRNGSIFSGATGIYLDLQLNIDPSTGANYDFPTDPVNLTIDYELDGSPVTKTITFVETDLPIGHLLVDETNGDFSNIRILSITGTLTTYTNEFTYSVYVQEKSNQIIDSTIIRIFGIQFSNIQYPHPNIVGHYFVRAKRDDQNRNILDKGFASQLRAKQIGPNKYVTFGYFNGDINEQTKNNYLFTPRFQFNKDILAGQYLKQETEFVFGSSYIGSVEEDGVGSKVKEINSIIEYRVENYNGVSNANGEHNYKVEKSIILDGASKDLKFEGSATPLYNLSWSNRVQVVNTAKILPRVAKNMPYVSYKVNRNIHPILDEIKYQRIHNSMLTIANSNKVYGGDVFISRWDIANSLFRKKKKGILKTLLNILIIAAATAATVVTAGVTGPAIATAVGAALAAGIETAVVVTALVAGAIGVTTNGIQLIVGEIEDGDLRDMTDDSELNDATGGGIRLSSYMAYANELLTGLYVESEVNVGLRQEEHHVCGAFYRFQQTFLEYFRSRWLYFDTSTGKWTAKGFCCPETYQYNKDYSRENEQSVYFPLPNTYDCCSECLESHPNRARWSEESFQEELSDNYRVFLPNNYIDIEAEHGEITAMVKRNNNLFFYTSEAMWLVPQSQQERVTNELISFIGTGEFLSIPPKKIIDSEIGTAGTQHKWSILNMPDGLLSIDEGDSAIYLYNQGFDNLASAKYGNERWFKDNLTDSFARQFKLLTDKDFPNQNNPANPYGTGIHSVYDGEFNRIIITKIDYLILAPFISSFITVNSIDNVMPAGLVNNQLVFDLTTGKFIRSNGSQTSYQIIEFTNPEYFENKSWTMSFSLKDKQWTSWHSYIPNYYIYNHENFYSFISGSNKLWQHNVLGLYQKFYDKAYPYEVEIVLKTKNLSTQYWEELAIQSTARKYDPTSQDYIDQKDVTFNKLIAYNSRQSTGELKLKLKVDKDDYFLDQINNLAGEVIISRNEKDWNINDLRDYIVDPTNPLFLKNWSAIKNYYFIDKVVNQNNINYFKDWTELESLRDKFLIVRLKFDNFTDVQLFTNYVLDTKGTSLK